MRRNESIMEDYIRVQLSIDDIGTGTNSQQNTTSGQNAPSQRETNEYKQHIPENAQTRSDSTGRNDTGTAVCR